MKKILFIDDDPKYQMVIQELLNSEGYHTVIASNAADGLQLFKQDTFDLVISDLMMSSIDGLQFLTLLRRLDKKVRVIILTGSTDDQDEIKSMKLMANDYVKKPVSMDVLLARVSKVLNEGERIEENILISNNLTVDLQTRRVYLDDVLVDLALREYELLVFFLKNRNVVLTRQEILKEVWNHDDLYIDNRTVDSHVKKIRAKLHLLCIYSVRGFGYEWID